MGSATPGSFWEFLWALWELPCPRLCFQIGVEILQEVR